MAHRGPPGLPSGSAWLPQLVLLTPQTSFLLASSGPREASAPLQPARPPLSKPPCPRARLQPPLFPASQHVLPKWAKVVPWGASPSHRHPTKSFRTPPGEAEVSRNHSERGACPSFQSPRGTRPRTPLSAAPRLHFGCPPFGAPTPGGLQAFCPLAAPQHLLHTDGLWGRALQVLRQLQQQHLCLGLPPTLPGGLRGRHGPVLRGPGGLALSLALRRGVAIGVSGTAFWFLVSGGFTLGLGSFYSLLRAAQSIRISERRQFPCPKITELGGETQQGSPTAPGRSDPVPSPRSTESQPELRHRQSGEHGATARKDIQTQGQTSGQRVGCVYPVSKHADGLR